MAVRAIRLCVLMAGLLTLVGCASVSEQSLQMVGRPAPSTRLTMLNGDYVPLDEYSGKHIFMTFWATWCMHSKPAIRDFDELAQEYGRNPNFVFLGVSVDRLEDFPILKKRIQSLGLTHIKHAFSGNDVGDEAYEAFYGELLPYVVIIDPKGTVRAVDTGVGAVEDYIEGLRR